MERRKWSWQFRRRPDEYKIRSQELINKQKLNVKRASEWFDKARENGISEELIREAESVFMATGATLADVAWVAGMNNYGLSRQEVLDIWTTKQNKTDELRERLHKG